MWLPQNFDTKGRHKQHSGGSDGIGVIQCMQSWVPYGTSSHRAATKDTAAKYWTHKGSPTRTGHAWIGAAP